MTLGLSKLKQHKDIISESNLKKIATYLKSADINPVNLRLCVQYNISVQFVTRGFRVSPSIG